jgi:hypothetical protein
MKKDKADVDPESLTDMPEWTDDDWARAKPNRFAGTFDNTVTVVTLDREVAEAFPTSEEVNKALRSLLPAATKTSRVRPAAPKA